MPTVSTPRAALTEATAIAEGPAVTCFVRVPLAPDRVPAHIGGDEHPVVPGGPDGQPVGACTEHGPSPLAFTRRALDWTWTAPRVQSLVDAIVSPGRGGTAVDLDLRPPLPSGRMTGRKATLELELGFHAPEGTADGSSFRLAAADVAAGARIVARTPAETHIDAGYVSFSALCPHVTDPAAVESAAWIARTLTEPARWHRRGGGRYHVRIPAGVVVAPGRYVPVEATTGRRTWIELGPAPLFTADDGAAVWPHTKIPAAHVAANEWNVW